MLCGVQRRDVWRAPVVVLMGCASGRGHLALFFSELFYFLVHTNMILLPFKMTINGMTSQVSLKYGDQEERGGDKIE